MNDNQIQQPQATETAQAPAQQQQGKSAMAIAGLVIGIVALVLSVVPIVNNFAFILVVLGVIFAVVGIIGTGAGKKGGRGLAIAALVISIIAGIAVLGSQALYGAALDSASEALDKSVAESSKNLDKMSGKATDEILGTEVDVELGDFTVTTGSYGVTKTSLPVTVTNLLDEPKTITVQVEAVDESGNRIDDSSVYTSKLGAGQSQTCEAFTLVTSDKVDTFKNAKFNVVSVSEF